MTTLKQALKTLDPKNDEHWTAGGLPRVDVLEQLTGGSVTRDEIEAAAPDLKRSTAPELNVAHDPATVQLSAGAGGGGGGPGASSLGATQGGGGPGAGHISGGGGGGRAIGDGVIVGDIEGRVAAIEADLAFLRNLFGWPTRTP